MVEKEEVLEALKEVIDPELGINIVDLGLICDVEIEKGYVRIRMTFTTPFCPLAGMFLEQIKNKVLELKGVKDVDVELTFDEPWSPERMSEDARRKLGL
ncbi:aromatic ring hydroxylase [Nanoarchaeota archaeon]|nr:metal-sulfur cluster assembly factor [Nanoarchaeota archaeon]RLG17780.1 MAG: aromatic ring hydroxylase [Nanoarchaeota archaeon]